MKRIVGLFYAVAIANGMLLGVASPASDVQEEADPFMTVDEVAALVRLPRKSIYTMRYNGRAPRAYAYGRHVRFRRSDVMRWLEEHADPPTGDTAA